MRIYFCGSILGGRDDAAIYRHIVDWLQLQRHTVTTSHVADADVLEKERSLSDRAIFERDQRWLHEADAVIAEVSNPSLGVGYEIAIGIQRGIPVLCVYREGLRISRMITGNNAPNLEVRTYEDINELDLHLAVFLYSPE